MMIAMAMAKGMQESPPLNAEHHQPVGQSMTDLQLTIIANMKQGLMGLTKFYQDKL
ncbi:MAG: hypothetical protein HYW50_01330 [Candidatus Diapherotrites archaeon]|nr:hypothetical protein [Candidatus Diapherotrites archaeon]